jgi:alanine dehydrogenase
MNIGIPREVKTLEGRVGLVPAAVAELVKHGHTLLVEQGAGVPSGYTDEEYRAAGASIASTASELYGGAEMILKVKEPQPQELEMLRADHLLFCFLHLAAEPTLMASLLEIGLTGVAFETVSEERRLPLLAPMSDIAGRIAAQNGAQLLQRPAGGKGLLLGGLPAAERGHVVVLGGGVVGGNATAMVAAMGARVTVFDRNRDKLAALRSLGANVTGLYPYADAIDRAVHEADLLIGAVLIPGEKAPHLVSAEQVAGMQPGSVIIDVAVDQGGCIETTRPTSWAEPTFIYEEVFHFGVTNMPGAVPRSASQALSAALIPYALKLAADEWNDSLRAGVNVEGGKVVHPALRQ